MDVYFDNVGGEILDTVLTRINRNARIFICGAISQYNNTTRVKDPGNYLPLLVNRARMQGMVVFDYAERYGVAIKDIAHWIKEGKFMSREDVVPVIENFPATLNKLFNGENFGKLVLKVAGGWTDRQRLVDLARCDVLAAPGIKGKWSRSRTFLAARIDTLVGHAGEGVTARLNSFTLKNNRS